MFSKRLFLDGNLFLFVGELNLPMTDDEFLAKSNELYTQAFPSAELLPGAERLIRHLANYNIPMGMKLDLLF